MALTGKLGTVNSPLGNVELGKRGQPEEQPPTVLIQLADRAVAKATLKDKAL